MAKKIFISPSDQKDNKYAYGNTTEAVQCGKIASALEDALKRCGFETRLLHYYTMAEKVSNANKWGADLYIPIHTNACNGKVSGTRIFSYDDSGAGRKAAKCVFKYLSALTPGKSENITSYPDLYEVKNPAAPTVYCECEFHDVKETAKWICEHTTDIGEAICKGVCEYFGVKYKEPVKATTTTKTIYRVQVGAYSVKANAEAMQKKLKADGYDAIIVEK